MATKRSPVVIVTESRVRRQARELFARLKAYVRKLLYPLYLFPLKLATYSAYYFVRFLIRILIGFLRLIWDMIRYPFRGVRNFLKSLFIIGLILYVFASLFVILDYIRIHYGWYDKFFCVGVNQKLKDSVVRVVGGYSEGTGFFVSETEILTNFHVITGEPSPKIIFADGSFTTPVSIVGNKGADMAILTIDKPYPDKVLPLMDPLELFEDEPIIAAGYPMGTDIVGEATIVKGNFLAFRQSRQDPVNYLHADLQLVGGMSGGPLVDSCGDVVGINTGGVGGQSFFININSYKVLKDTFNDADVTKISLDPSASPEEAVKAFYTYLKVRDMEKGFALLSAEYLKKTDFQEWTNRFTDILDVDVLMTKKEEGRPDSVFVKFMTKNWVDGEMEIHYFEGTWATVFEDGVYKMLRSYILEVDNPGWEWFY